MTSIDRPDEASELGLTLAAPNQLKTGLALMQAEFVAMDKAAAAAAMTVDGAGGAVVDPTVPVAAGKVHSPPSDAATETSGAADSSRPALARMSDMPFQETGTATLGSRNASRQQSDDWQLSALGAFAGEQSSMQGGPNPQTVQCGFDRQTVGVERDQRSAVYPAVPDLSRNSAEYTAPVVPFVSEVPIAMAPVQDSDVESGTSQIELLDESFAARTIVAGGSLEVTDAPVIGTVRSAVDSVRSSRELARAGADFPDFAIEPLASQLMRFVPARTTSRVGLDDAKDGEAGAEDESNRDGAFAPSSAREGGESGGGAVILDGRLVGEWLMERMARQALRPGAGTTFFDVRQGPAWTPSGAL